jgi:hypothetical protein
VHSSRSSPGNHGNNSNDKIEGSHKATEYGCGFIKASDMLTNENDAYATSFSNDADGFNSYFLFRGDLPLDFNETSESSQRFESVSSKSSQCFSKDSLSPGCFIIVSFEIFTCEI